MLGLVDKSIGPWSSPFTIKLSFFLSITSQYLLTFKFTSTWSLFKSNSTLSIVNVLNAFVLSLALSTSISWVNGISSVILYTGLNPSTGVYSISTETTPSTMFLFPSKNVFSTNILVSTLTTSFICISSFAFFIVSLILKNSLPLFNTLFNSIFLLSNFTLILVFDLLNSLWRTQKDLGKKIITLIPLASL